MSPLQVEMLLHYHARANAFPRLDAPACSDTLKWLIEIGAIAPCDSEKGHDITPLGSAWVQLICETPVPARAFVDPRTLEIIKP